MDQIACSSHPGEICMDQIACSSHPGEICPRIPHSNAPHPQCHTQEQIPLLSFRCPLATEIRTKGGLWTRRSMFASRLPTTPIVHKTLVLSPRTQEMVQSIMIRNHNLQPEPTALLETRWLAQKSVFFFVNHPDDSRP